MRAQHRSLKPVDVVDFYVGRMAASGWQLQARRNVTDQAAESGDDLFCATKFVNDRQAYLTLAYPADDDSSNIDGDSQTKRFWLWLARSPRTSSACLH
jgi:hypothetical protein